MSNYKQQVIDFFEQRTAYDTEGESHPNEAKRLLEYVELKSGQNILDIATGTGLVAITAAKQVAPNGSVIGVDISSGMLNQASQKIEGEKIKNLKLTEADIESIEFSAEKFDVIFCCSALVYISDIPKIIEKCHNWLKPGGCFAFTTPDRTSYFAEVRIKLCKDLFNIDLPHIIRPLWTAEKCQNLLQESNFKDIHIEQHLYSKSQISQNYSSARIEKEFYPRGNPLSNLSRAEKDLLQVEYTKTIEQLIQEQGRWQESLNLYVRAYK